MYINPKQPKCLTNFLLLWKARCQYAQWRAIQFCQSSYASPFPANTESPWKGTIQWNLVGLCGFGRCNIFMIIHAYLAYWVLYIIVYPHIDSVISVESFLKTLCSLTGSGVLPWGLWLDVCLLLATGGKRKTCLNQCVQTIYFHQYILLYLCIKICTYIHIVHM